MFFEILAIAGAVLGAASLILHKVAPMTKTKVDDKVLDVVDFMKDEVLPMAPKPAAKPDPGKTVGFGTSTARDHRTGK